MSYSAQRLTQSSITTSESSVSRSELTYRLERNIANWTSLEERATEILHHIPKEKKSAYIQLVWMPVSLVTNLNKLHAAGRPPSPFFLIRELIGLVRRNNVYAHQARTSANIEGKKAIEHFEQDFNLSRIFNELEDGKWDQYVLHVQSYLSLTIAVCLTCLYADLLNWDMCLS
jgi:hypothetical protein